jgi:hypothetical protein
MERGRCPVLGETSSGSERDLFRPRFLVRGTLRSVDHMTATNRTLLLSFGASVAMVAACDCGHFDRGTAASTNVVNTRLADDAAVTYRVTFTAEGKSTNPSSGDGEFVVDDWNVPPGAAIAIELDCGEPLNEMEGHELPRTQRRADGVVVDADLHQAMIPFRIDCTFSLLREDTTEEVSVQWHIDASIGWESKDDVDLSVEVEEL